MTAYAEVRQNLRRSVERNKRYYDLGLKPKQFAVGQLVPYFNPRKLRGKQMKWIRQYEGPFLITATLYAFATDGENPENREDESEDRTH